MHLLAAISPSVSLRTLLGSWQLGAPSLIALGVEVTLAGWYVWASHRLRARGRRWSGWRTASFLTGTVLVVIAVQSGLAAYDDSVFALHVVQHLLLMNFAPLLWALGAPVTLALQSSSRPRQRALLQVLHNPAVEALTHPAVVVALAYGTMLVYLLSPLYRLSLEHLWLHDLAHLHFLVAGSLFWWVVVGLDPSRHRLTHPRKLAVLAAGVPVGAILGLTLTNARASIAPAFHTVADTRAGGSILWVVSELTTLVAIGIVLAQWMAYEERVAVRADRRADAAEARAEEARAADTGTEQADADQADADQPITDQPDSAAAWSATSLAPSPGRSDAAPPGLPD